MRAFHSILGALAALGLVAMASPPALAQGKINVGYVTASDFVPLLVAKEKGFFEKRGLDVEPKRIPIITNIPPALVSGDLQMGSSTMPLLLRPIEAIPPQRRAPALSILPPPDAGCSS